MKLKLLNINADSPSPLLKKFIKIIDIISMNKPYVKLKLDSQRTKFQA